LEKYLNEKINNNSQNNLDNNLIEFNNSLGIAIEKLP
jgi:hypothetical protein